MANNLALNQKGAKPFYPTPTGRLSSGMTQQTTGGFRNVNPQPVMGGNTQGFLTKASTPVKSIATPDGTKITYHIPGASAAENKAGMSLVSEHQKPITQPTQTTQTSTGMLNTFDDGFGQKFPSQADASASYAKKNVSQPTQTPTPTPTYSTTPSEQAGFVAKAGQPTDLELQTLRNIMSKSNTSSDEYQQAQSAYQKAIQDYNQSIQNQAIQMGGEANRAIPLQFVQGRQQVLQGQYAAQQAGLGGLVSGASAALGQANTQQQLQQQAAATALGATQTQAARGLTAQKELLTATQPVQVSPGNTLVSPITGQPTYGLGGGTGAGAYQAFQNLQFNTQQGQQLGLEASNIQTASNQMDANFQTLATLAQKYGINMSQYPDINSLVQTLQSKVGGGAGAVSAFNEAYNALATSISSIINNSGAFTPTEVTALTQQVSAAKLSPAAMQQLYDTLRATAATRINAKLEQAKNYENAGTGSVTANMQPASGAPQPLITSGQTITTPSGLTINPNF